jgi:GH24 family phage-related lysozyme (muramidase)
MNDKTREWMVDELKKDEGLVLHIYHLKGIPHIGYGFNLQANHLPAFIQSYLDIHGDITNDMADFLLRKTMISAEADIVHLLPSEVWEGLTEKRQAVIVMMDFNMGIGHLMGFHDFLGCLSENDIPGCLREMEDSEWFRNPDTHDRAVKLIGFFKEG